MTPSCIFHSLIRSSHPNAPRLTAGAPETNALLKPQRSAWNTARSSQLDYRIRKSSGAEAEAAIDRLLNLSQRS
jgi:hypothetical protein